MRTPFFFGALAGLGLLAATWSARPQTQDAVKDGLDARVAKLEAWRDSVEQRFPLFRLAAPQAARPGPAESKPTDEVARALIQVRVANKRLEKVRYDDYIVFDIWYIATALTRDARCVKGTLEFADMFGEVKFRLETTLDKGIKAGATVYKNGSGFDYNHFMAPHDWMLGTDVNDMKVSMRVNSVLYHDGTVESF